MFRRRVRDKAGLLDPAATVPPGTVVWAVGDIHGQNDLFDYLAAVIEADVLQSASACKVVLLGDYIDRGLGTRKVIDRAIQLRSNLERLGAEAIFLRGNHEDLLLRFLYAPATGPAWMEVGGRETMISYGLPPPAIDDVDAWDQASQKLLTLLPARHLRFYASLVLYHQEGDFHFVHAGARPGVSLLEQTAEDQVWIRDAFIKDTQPFDKIVVHGHSPGVDVHIDGRRIGLDTGAYATGILSGLRIAGTDRQICQARRLRGDVKLDRRMIV